MNRDYKYRFVGKMSFPNSLGCIKYLGALSKTGYGVFDIDHKSYSAHRISYELFVGKIPKNKFVLHKCDNRNCIAPLHLFLGSQADNIEDMVKKKRNSCGIGEKHGHSKLDKSQIIEIRILLKKGILLKKIAEKFNVSQSTISDIKFKRTWNTI